MIFVADIGNTNIVVGGLTEDSTVFTARLSTDHKKTDLEYAIDLNNILEIFRIDKQDIDGLIMSSVVPQITDPVRQAMEEVFDKPVMIVNAKLKTGLQYRVDHPELLGADRITDAAAAAAEYPLPAVIVDMGTATTFSAVNDQREFLGGAIYPGVRISLDALTDRASKLSGISLEKPEHVIGPNTLDAMRSGILYGSASVIDGIADRMEQEIGKPVTVIATGGMSGLVVPFCRRKVIRDENLLLKGLRTIYQMN